MDPTKLINDDDYLKGTESLADEILAYRSASTRYREQTLEPQWSRALRLLKGIPLEEESSISKTRGKSKIYFRKVWSSAIRLLATFHQAFLQDKKRFRILGRDDEADHFKAKVLEKVVAVRLERMMRRGNAYVRLLWALMGCVSPGFAVIKQFWKFNEELEIDEPDFTVYPLEQVCLDWTSLTYGNPQDMRFAMFDNYFTKEQMEEPGYENVSKVTETMVPQSELQQARYAGSQDPHNTVAGEGQNYSNGAVGHSYPDGGSSPEDRNPYLRKYLCTEVFWKKKGYIYFCVINPETKTFLVPPMKSPYGREYPICLGSMLIEPHKPVPEGIDNVVAGPQEALNQTINMRFDNVALAMQGGFIYSRFAGIDKQSLRNLHPGFSVAANDIGGIAPIKLPDVTQSAYMEAGQFINMIDEETGVNPTKQGNSESTKATVASINLSEANAKHDLYTATVAQTLFQQFVYNLARHCAMFEVDEKIMRIANEMLREEGMTPTQHGVVYDIEFDFDLEVNVGASEVSRAAKVNRFNAVFDRLMQSNNSTFMALQSGIQIPKPKIFNLGEMMAELLPEYDFPNVQRYLVPVAPPPPEEQGSGGETKQAAAGAQASQPNAAGDAEFMKTIMSQMGMA